MKLETLRNKYEFTRDDNCITLYKIVKVISTDSKNYGQEARKVLGYYSTIEGLLKKLVFLELIDKGSLNDLLDDVVQVNKLLHPIIKELQGVTE